MSQRVRLAVRLEGVVRRRVLLGCWGAWQDPQVCDYRYETMNDWGKAMYVTPGIVVDGELVTTDLVDITLGMRILLGSSYYDDWVDEEPFVTHDPLGNPIDMRNPWDQTTLPVPQKRDFDDKYSWVMSPRWYDRRTGDHLALDTGGGPFARLYTTALAGLDVVLAAAPEPAGGEPETARPASAAPLIPAESLLQRPGASR